MLVFQYGSNCDASELNGPDRLDGWADLGRAATVQTFEFAFSKRFQLLISGAFSESY
jgi:hypothetical protein